jgi:glycosyltransferase involved in cell wall biosynthesis
MNSLFWGIGLGSLQSPCVSVVMPVYNAAEFISASVDSILSQSFDDFEFIIVDDASVDNTPDILQKITDGRVRIITRKENGGIVAALNDGLAVASGKYIARQDADDISVRERFAKQVEVLETVPDIGIVSSWYGKIDENGKHIVDKIIPEDNESICKLLENGNCFCHGSIMFRRSLLDKSGVYRDTAGPTEDYDLWLRMLPLTKVKCFQEVLYLWRVNFNSIMSGADDEFILRGVEFVKSLNRVRKTTGKDPLEEGDENFIAEFKTLKNFSQQGCKLSANKARARMLFHIAEDCYKVRDFSKAYYYLFKAILHSPFEIMFWRFLLGIIRSEIMDDHISQKS